jgi:hypothetical protein
MWESGGVAPLINLDTRDGEWSQPGTDSFTPRERDFGVLWLDEKQSLPENLVGERNHTTPLLPGT